jgi:hypothetical protein
MLLNSILPNWSEISVFEQAFWIIAIPATVFFLLLLVLTIFGGDADADVDVDTDVDGDIAGDSIPFQFISLKNIVAFFTVFGWSGIGFISMGLSPGQVILFSTLCGLAMMFFLKSY